MIGAAGSIFASSLEARLRLTRLGRLGAEAVDESLQALALRLVFLPGFGGERLSSRRCLSKEE